MTCTCEKTDTPWIPHRHWDPDCPEHGRDTEWYNAPQRVEDRKQIRRLIDKLGGKTS